MNIKKVKQSRISLGYINPNNPDKEYFLFYTLNSIAEMEEKFGTVDKAMNLLSSGKIKDIRQLIWFGLIHQEAKLDEVTGDIIGYNITPAEIGNWISITDMKDITLAIKDAFMLQVSDPSDEATQNNLIAIEALEKKMEAQGIQLAKISEEEKSAKLEKYNERKK